MIATLSLDQEKMLDVYAKKYIDIGLKTDRFSEEYATSIIHAFQEKVLECKKTPVIVFDNPMECMLAIHFVCIIEDANFDEITVKVGDKVEGNVRVKVWDKVMDKVWVKVMDKVEAKVRDNVMDKVGDKVRAKVEAKVRAMNGIYPYQDGSFSANVFAFYDYMIEILKIDLSEFPYQEWRDTVNLGLIYPLDNVCIVCQKPTHIRTNEKGLHADMKPALEYAGGWNIYSLNGIIVPEELAMTPAGELDIDLFLREKSADIKAEFIRKYGIERMLEYGTLVDGYKNYDNEWWTKSEYEVWDMKKLFVGITRHNQCCFLKMKNLTTGTWHLEGINPNHGEIKNVEQALDIREKVKQKEVKETLWIV